MSDLDLDLSFSVGDVLEHAEETLGSDLDPRLLKAVCESALFEAGDSLCLSSVLRHILQDVDWEGLCEDHAWKFEA